MSAVADLRDRLGSLTLRDEHRLRRRLRHARDPDALERLAAEVEAAEARVARRRAAMPAISYPDELPVSARREDLLEASAANQVVVEEGEVGLGKNNELAQE